MEFGREVFHDGLEPLDASRLAQGEKVRCATPAFHRILCSSDWREGEKAHGCRLFDDGSSPVGDLLPNVEDLACSIFLKLK